MQLFNSSVRKEFNLRLKSGVLFGKGTVFSTFSSTSNIQAGNLNLGRSNIGVLGLIFILPIILSLPCLFNSTNTALSSRREGMSTVVATLFRVFHPVHRAEASYTVGGELSFEDVVIGLTALIADLKSAKCPLNSGDISSPLIFGHFRDCVVRELESIVDCGTKDEFVSKCLGVLSNTQKFLSVGSRDWDVISPFFNGSSPETLPLGIRKLFRLAPGVIGSGSDMVDVSKLYLYDTFIDESEVLCCGIKFILNAPTSGCVVVTVTTERSEERLRRVLLDFRIEVLEGTNAGTPAPGKPEFKKHASIPGTRGFSTQAFEKPKVGVEIEGFVYLFYSIIEMERFVKYRKLNAGSFKQNK